MKNIPALSIVISAVLCLAAAAYAENDCPYDDDYKYALKKALADYLNDPASSQFSLGEVKDMLGFYLRKDSITNSECTQNIKGLLQKADKIDDRVFSKAGGHGLKKCNVCQDGTLCAEKNDKGQSCLCKDTNGDNFNEYCALKPVIAPKAYCEVCPDGTLCDEQNDKEQTCFCKDCNSDGKYEHCYLRPLKAWPEPCDKCEDGTACDKNNNNGETCLCRDINKDGVTEICRLYLDEPPHGSCAKCHDGTSCGQAKNKNLVCSCTDTNKDGKFEICRLKRPDAECSQCSDGTACGKTNAYDQLCKCTDTNRDGKSEICMLMPSYTVINKCSACIDGTECGKTSGNNLCVCRPEPHNSSKYFSCQLSPYCSGCADGTPCGQTNSDGKACTCYNNLGKGAYQRCILECNDCEDGTKCGEVGPDGRTCVCRWEARKRGLYMECLSRCDKCADSTPCFQKNKDNKLCLCTGIDPVTKKYARCEILDKNHTTSSTVVSSTTQATTTSTTTTTEVTSSTTLAPEEQLTASNLQSCIEAKQGKLYLDIDISSESVDQKMVFYKETTPPVGPGEPAYVALAIEGSTGTVPRWEYVLAGQDMTVFGCKTFAELNEIFLCGLKAVPGHTYQEC